jgi:Txe/YoeB family toxin of Txe-Axe toxin-antitoxin module
VSSIGYGPFHVAGEFSFQVSSGGIESSNRLEALKGERKGQWSIRINDQWRICFEWRDGNAEEVEIADYH